MPLDETRATCQGYSFFSVSTPPIILLDLFGMPQLQESPWIGFGNGVSVVVLFGLKPSSSESMKHLKYIYVVIWLKLKDKT